MENINVNEEYCLAKSIADASWFTNSVFKKEEKQFHQVGMFFPSSKTCSSCGEKKTDLTLSDRIIVVLFKTINAALNLTKE